MTRRELVAAGSLVALALLIGWAVSLATARVENWFVMTDELYYQRLAIAVAQTGSLLPQIHGELVANVNQLYPVLISMFYGDGNVVASFDAAHLLNPFVMVTAAIPVFLLARRTGVGLLGSVWVGTLAVAVPWIVLSSFLLTEVVAYPAFCWGLLMVTRAVSRRSEAADLAAIAMIGLAALARVQLLLLAAVLLVAVATELLLAAAADGARGRELARAAAGAFVRRRALTVGVLVLAAAALSGGSSRLLGSYSVTAETFHLDLGLVQLAAEHVAILALGLALLPFFLGVAWLIDQVRPSAPAAERALGVVGCATLSLLTLEVASFDQRFGAGLVKDRYLFYAVPVVLVALAAAASAERWPRWWTFVIPAVPVAIGFVTVPLVAYEKFNVDSPLAMLNDGLLRLATSVTWARALLVLATVVAVQVLLVGGSFVPRRVLAIGAVVVATVCLPLETVYAFERLFRVNGTNGLPITLDQGGVFNWIDRNVGPAGRVTMAPYPVNSPQWWAGQAYWWDVEFWNESVVDTWGAPRDPWVERFDPHTGVAVENGRTRYLLMHSTDVRFRLAGRQVAFDRGAYIFEPVSPWRAAWLTRGTYADGWTRPHTPAEIVVFAEPGQTEPLQRFVFVAASSPDLERARLVTVSSNLDRWQTSIAPGGSLEREVTVCVPPGGSGTISIETPFVSDVYRDPTVTALTGETDRPAGIHLRTVALADERVPLERCQAALVGR